MLSFFFSFPLLSHITNSLFSDFPFFPKAASAETHSVSDDLMSLAEISHLLSFLTLLTLSCARALTPHFARQAGGAQKTVITLHLVLQLFP